MACPQCEASRQQQLDSCAHCGLTLIAIPALGHAKELARQRLWQQAEAALVEVVKQHPKCSEAYLLLGATAAGMGRADLAVGHFEEAVRLAIANAPARYNLAMAYKSVGRIEDARQQLQYALQIMPGYDRAQAALSQLPGAPPAQAAGGMATIDERPAPAAQPAAGRMPTMDDEIRPMGGGEQAAAAPSPWQPQAQPTAAQGSAEQSPPQPRRAPMEEPAVPQAKGLNPVSAGVAAGAAIFGSVMLILFFRMLTSPTLIDREAAFMAFATRGTLIVAVLAGVAGAAAGGRGVPLSGLLGGLVACTVGWMILGAAEGFKPPMAMLAGLAAGGAALGALGEVGTSAGPLAERRSWVLWGAILISAFLVGGMWLQRGSVTGTVWYTVTLPDGTTSSHPVPGAKVTMYDQSGQKALYSVNTLSGKDLGGGLIHSGSNGMFTFRNIPKGDYKLFAETVDGQQTKIKQGVSIQPVHAVQQDLFMAEVIEAPPPEPVAMPEDVRQRMSPEFVPGGGGPTKVLAPGGGTISVPTEAPSSLDSGEE